MASGAIDFGAEYGHDFNQILAKLFHGWFIRLIIQNGDFDTQVLADLEYNFTAEAQQAVFVRED